MTVPTRQVCDTCFELIRGFGSMQAYALIERCDVCGKAGGGGHRVHANAAENCHRRLCDKLEAERKTAESTDKPCPSCGGIYEHTPVCEGEWPEEGSAA